MGKKRVEKKAEKMRRKKVHEILEMVLEINTTYPREREYTGIMPTAFFSFSGWNDKGYLHNGFTDWLDASVKFNQMEELKGKVEKIQEELRHAGKM